MLMDAFHAGGAPMYPILLFGILLLAAAVRYARGPDERQQPLLRSLVLVNLTAGGLGTMMGIVRCFSGMSAVKAEERALIMAAGLSEAVNNISQALLWVLLASLVTAVGAFRAASRPATKE